MGYFANGTEGMLYMEEFCDSCVHGEDCAVWKAHLEYSYKESNNPESILHLLIPRTGIQNEPCRMYINQGGESDDKVK